MTDDSKRYKKVVSHISRRRVLAAAGTVGAGSLTLMTMPKTTAAVSVDELEIPDREFSAESVTPEIALTLAYDYDVGTTPVSDLGFTLAVDGTIVAEDILSTERSVFSGTTDLSGLVTDSEAWAASDFAPEVTESVSRELSIAVTFDVLDRDQEAIATATASETATVSVSHPTERVLVASVGGDGEIRRPE